jgi:hypothetical protein
MKANLEDLKADLYNVFVKGDANNRELARVYFNSYPGIGHYIIDFLTKIPALIYPD